MRLSQKVRYGVACLFELAKSIGEFVDTDHIVSRQNIPLAYAHKVLQSLAHAGLVIAQKGSGYQLARPLHHITVLQVIEALSAHEEAAVTIPAIGNVLEQRVNKALSSVTLDALGAR